MTLEHWLSTTRALGIAAALGLLVCSLALQDIARGEADVANEWTAVGVGFILMALFIAVSFTTLSKVQRAVRKTRLGAGPF